MAAFLHLLDSHIPLHEDGDRRLKKNEEFDICSFYNANSIGEDTHLLQT